MRDDLDSFPTQRAGTPIPFNSPAIMKPFIFLLFSFTINFWARCFTAGFSWEG
jgi:hypothetical protein